MLPDYPKVKSLIGKQLMEFFQARINIYMGDVFSQVPKSVIHEGKGHSTRYADDMVYEKEWIKIGSGAELSCSELLDSPEMVFKILDDMAKDLAFQQTKVFVEAITDVTMLAGNQIQVKGNITVDHFLEMMDRIQISFNLDGTPNLPTLMGGEKIFEDMKTVFAEMDENPDHLKKLGDIIEKKKIEFHERENSRKLVD